MLNKLIEIIKNKNVFLCTHWDADGVTSGALLYHLIKNHVKSIKTKSKGLTFSVEKKDIVGNPDIIICSDIKPSLELNPKKIVYVDHHPDHPDSEEKIVERNDYLLKIFDDKYQSCSLVIWNKLIPKTNNPYFIFLALLGYFGDGGNEENIPFDLFIKAKKLLNVKGFRKEYNLMDLKKSYYSDKNYFEIEKFVSPLNTGKRVNWSGDIPLELLKSIDNFLPFINKLHPIARRLEEYRAMLRQYYNMKINIKSTKKIEYSQIKCPYNVQGVLASRHLKDKPLMIINTKDDLAIASLRVPELVDFDAGKFLSKFNGKIPGLLGGGHEKAGGITFNKKYLKDFLEIINKDQF